MRLRGWDIEHFGHLDGHRADGLGDHLNVVVAPNEFGKTTLHHFVRWTVFGYPTAGTNDVKRYRPDRSVNLGGRVTVNTSVGDVVVERFLKPGRPTISCRATGRELTQEQLTGPVTREMYEAVFAVGLDELHGLASLSEPAVREQIFAAGLVGHGRSAAGAIRELDDRIAELLTPRKGAIREYHHELVSARDDLRRARAASLGVGAARAEADRAQVAALGLDDELDVVRADQDRLTRLVELVPGWSAAMAAAAEMASLPDSELGPDPIGHLEADLHRVAESDAESRAARDELEALRARRSGIVVDDRLADAADHIDDAWASVNAEAARRLDLDRRAEQLRARRLELEGRIRDQVAPDWDSSRIRALDRSHSSIEELSRAAAEVTRAEAARDRAGDAARASRAARASMPAVPVDGAGGDRLPELTDLLGLVTALDHAATPDGADVGSGAPRRAIAASALGIAIVVVVIGMTLAVTGRLLAGTVLTIAGVVGMLAAGTRRSTAVAPERSEMESEAAAIAGRIGLAERPERSVVVELIEHERQETERRRRDRDERGRLDAEVERADRELARRAGGVDDAAAAWRSELVRWQLPSGLDPAAAVAAVDAAVAIEATISDLDRFDAELDSIRRELDGMVTGQIGSLARIGIEVPADAPLAERRTTLAAARAAAAGAVGARNQARQLDQRIEEHLAPRSAATAHAHRQAVALVQRRLGSVGAADVDEYRRFAELAERRRSLRAVVDHAEQQLRASFGDRAEAARKELDLGRVDELSEARRRCRARVTELVELRRAAHARAADARHRVDQIEGSADVVSASMTVDRLEADLSAATADWLELVLARDAIERTLVRFQEDRQPEVVRWASAAFSRISAERWRSVTTGDGRIEVVDDRGRRLGDERLSRGATEQLYLCMRLGLALHQARRNGPLPMILDDVLVNADPARQERLAAELATVAQELQVILFTASHATAALLRRAQPGTTIIELS